MDEPIELTLRTTFSKNKVDLYNLLTEINEDYFGRAGEVRANVARETLHKMDWDMFSKDNIVLYPEKVYVYTDSYGEVHRLTDNRKFIGIFEKSKEDLLIYVSRDNLEYWEINLQGLVQIMREALNFWNTGAIFTDEEREEAEKEEILNDCLQEQQEESEAFWDEMDDIGLTEDDFEGRD